MIQQHDLIRKSRRQIEIVDHTDGDNVRTAGTLSDFLHEIDLMTNVEKGQRLIEE